MLEQCAARLQFARLHFGKHVFLARGFHSVDRNERSERSKYFGLFHKAALPDSVEQTRAVQYTSKRIAYGMVSTRGKCDRKHVCGIIWAQTNMRIMDIMFNCE